MDNQKPLKDMWFTFALDKANEICHIVPVKVGGTREQALAKSKKLIREIECHMAVNGTSPTITQYFWELAKIPGMPQEEQQQFLIKLVRKLKEPYEPDRPKKKKKK